MVEMQIYPISDLRIRVEVQDRLQRAEGLDATHVEVGVDHCEVRLSGRVWSQEERSWAGQIAEGVEGVKGVRNNLVVDAGPNILPT